MRLKIDEAGLNIKAFPSSSTSSLPSSTPIKRKSKSKVESAEKNKGFTFIWSLLSVILDLALVLVALTLTLCDITDLEKDAQFHLIDFPGSIYLHVINWLPRFLTTVIGFLLSVIVLILERNDKYQSLDAVICLFWFTSQISHIPETSQYIPPSELFIFKCILSAGLAVFSFVTLIIHFISSIGGSHDKLRKPRDVSFLNPSHKELVQSFRENNEILLSTPSSSSSSKCASPESLSDLSYSPSSSLQSRKKLNIKPDTALRKRLAELNISNGSKNNKLPQPEIQEEEQFDKLLEKLGHSLSEARRLSCQGVVHKASWISSGFWSTKSYGGNYVSNKDTSKTNSSDNNMPTGMFASFSASWARFIHDKPIGSPSLAKHDQIIGYHNNQVNPTYRDDSDSIDLRNVVRPSKLNMLPRLSYK